MHIYIRVSHHHIAVYASKYIMFNRNSAQNALVVVAEWLRRLTRNQMGFPRTGSNPVHDEMFFVFYRPQRSWGKVMFLHVSVTLSTISGGRWNTYGWQAGVRILLECFLFFLLFWTYKFYLYEWSFHESWVHLNPCTHLYPKSHLLNLWWKNIAIGFPRWWQMNFLQGTWNLQMTLLIFTGNFIFADDFIIRGYFIFFHNC